MNTNSLNNQESKNEIIIPSDNKYIIMAQSMTKDEVALLIEKNEILENEIIELRDENKKLSENSSINKLTGLHSRDFTYGRLKDFVNTYKRHGTVFSVLFLDIDFFKKVNDNYGHETGDFVLKGFANILKNNIRAEDVAGRWGGEEFVVILDSCKEDNAFKKAEEIRKKVEAELRALITPKNKKKNSVKDLYHLLSDKLSKDSTNRQTQCINAFCEYREQCEGNTKKCLRESITCSIGVTTSKGYGTDEKEINEKIVKLKKSLEQLSDGNDFPNIEIGKKKEIIRSTIKKLKEKIETPENIINRADKALYKAKEEGRNKVIYSEKQCNGKPLCKGKKFLQRIGILKKES